MKKITRFMILKRLKEILGEERFYRGLHLSLTGPEAGEVSVMLGLGASMRSLVGVEWHRETAVAAWKRYPDLRIHQKDIRDAACLMRGQLQSAVLDFCGHADADHLEAAKQVSRECLKPGGILVLGCHVGRENARKMAHYKLPAMKAYPVGAEKLQAYFKRAAYLTLSLQDAGLAVREWFFYRSRLDDKQGQPMVMVLCQKTVRKPHLRVYHFKMDDKQYDDYLRSYGWRARMFFNLR